MPPPRLSVRILERDYTLDAPANAHPRLKEAARQLDGLMRAHEARDTAADMTQIAVLAALELVTSPAISRLHERDIAKALAALQRKLERLDAVISASASAASGDSLTKK